MTLTGDRCRFLFVVLSPPDQPAAHLQVLSQIARVLKTQRSRDELLTLLPMPTRVTAESARLRRRKACDAAPPISVTVSLFDERRSGSSRLRGCRGSEAGLEGGASPIRGSRSRVSRWQGTCPYVKAGRLQILGESEYDYLATLLPTKRSDRLIRLVEPRRALRCLDARASAHPTEFFSAAEKLRGSVCIVTAAQTSKVDRSDLRLSSKMTSRRGSSSMACSIDVFSLGTLIVGDPGIGKSECALELVYRGHRLVADDIVVIRRTHHHGLRRQPSRAAGELPRASRCRDHRRAKTLRNDRDFDRSVAVSLGDPIDQADRRLEKWSRSGANR